MNNNPPSAAIHAAVEAARRSPCVKDQRGAAVFHESSHILVSGHNAPPEPFVCSGTDECKAACGKLAVHAEERALAHWIGPRFPDVLHIRVVNGEPVTSGEPSCITCSRTMLLHRVAGIWLWHEDGWRRYYAEEFHALSLQHPKHKLPVYLREVFHAASR